jgi:hypothetical protein
VLSSDGLLSPPMQYPHVLLENLAKRRVAPVGQGREELTLPLSCLPVVHLGIRVQEMGPLPRSRFLLWRTGMAARSYSYRMGWREGREQRSECSACPRTLYHSTLRSCIRLTRKGSACPALKTVLKISTMSWSSAGHTSQRTDPHLWP